MIYIDGPEGTGKTFLYKTLIHSFLSIGKCISDGIDAYCFNSTAKWNDKS